ncbi:MAG: type IV pilus modification protein PilV [Pontibacterium sp.]
MAVNRLSQTGYTLIEVLIALVVVSIGLLGMAALQVTSLKQNQNAYERSQAFLAAYDIVDRMRTNVTGFNDGDYFQGTDGFDDSDGADTSCEGSACTTSQLASYDLNNWKHTIQNELPSGGGCVNRIAESRPAFVVDELSDLSTECGGSNNTNLPVTIYLWWDKSRYDDESEAGGTDNIQVITVSVDI